MEPEKVVHPILTKKQQRVLDEAKKKQQINPEPQVKSPQNYVEHPKTETTVRKVFIKGAD